MANESQPAIQVVFVVNGSELAPRSGSSIGVVVNSTLGFGGDNGLVGLFNGTVSAQTTFVQGGANGAAWVILQETWNFLSIWEQNPVPGTL